MEEVEDVRHGGPESLDPPPVEVEDLAHEPLLAGRAECPLEQLAEGPLVLLVLVDVGDRSLGFQ